MSFKNLKNFGVPDPNALQIVMPQLSHRFRVRFVSGTPQASVDLTKSTIDVNFDLVNKRLYLGVSENIKGEVTKAAQILIRHNSPLVLESTDGNSDFVLYQMEFIDSKITEHNCSFSYKSSDIVMHHFVVEFSRIEIVFPEAT